MTIETSSTVMKNATQTSASACQRRGSGAVLGLVGSSVLPEVLAADPDIPGQPLIIASVVRYGPTRADT